MLTQEAFSATVQTIAEDAHCAAGAVIAMGAALATALGQATTNSTLAEAQEQGATEAIEPLRAIQQRLAEARATLLAIADSDAAAIALFVELRARGQPLQGYAARCDGPVAIALLAVHITQDLQAFRAMVCERTRDDLEFAITLLAGGAKAALQLLDSNLRIWPLPELLAKYDPLVRELHAQIGALMPVDRIRR